MNFLTMVTTVYPGDRLVDPLDGSIRTVQKVEHNTIFMLDGGCMGLDELYAEQPEIECTL